LAAAMKTCGSKGFGGNEGPDRCVRLQAWACHGRRRVVRMREVFMSSIRIFVAGVGFVVTALMVSAADAEEQPLGVRLVDQMNALYGAHKGARANHATGFVFEGTFTPAPGADALSSAAFLRGGPTPLVVRFSNAGGVPNVPDTDRSVDGIRGMAIKFR